MGVVAQLMVNVGADIKNFESGMAGVTNSLDGTQNSAQKVGGMMTSAGKSLTMGLTVPLIGMGAAAIKASTDFNEGMANVATLIPGNISRVNELKTSVQDMAVSTGKSTRDLSGGLYQVISAFGDTADTATILETNAKAAAAGLATTTDAINLTSAVTKGYGDTSAVAVGKVSDLAFQTVKLGQTTFPELAGSIGLVTPLASSLGVSMEEMFGVMATGSGVTGSASEVATQLRGVFQSLMAPTKEMTTLLQDLGYKSGDAMVQELGLQKTIDTIVGTAQKAGKPLQSYIGSIEGQTLALALAGAQSDTFSQKLAAMGDAAGATNQAFTDQTQGINANGFAMAQLQQKVATTAQNLGEALAPALITLLDALNPIIDGIGKLVLWFTNLDSTSQTIILTIIGVAAAIGPLITIIGSVISVMGTLTTIAGALGIGLLPLIGIVAAVVAAIVALIAIGVTLYKNWDTIKVKAKAIWDAIVKYFTVTVPAKMQAMVEWFKALPGKIITFLNALPGKLGYLFGIIVGKSIRFGIDMVNGIVNFVKNLPSNIATIFTNLMTMAVTKFTAIKSKVISIASNIVSGLRTAINKAPEVFRTMASNVLSFVSGLPGKLYSKAKEVATNFWNGFKKGLGMSSPSLVERAFTAIGAQAFATLKDIRKVVPKFQSEMFNITKPIPYSMTGTFGAQPKLTVTPPAVATETTTTPAGQPSPFVININGLTVREEADIEKIAQLLYRLQQKKSRGIGGVYSV